VRLLLAVVLAATLPLPQAGTKFKTLPATAGQADVEAACYSCHSADLLAQQRLTEKQWTAVVEKMMRWGADVPPEKKSVIIRYLAKHFGPSARFTPTKTAPLK
jgi:hypothetical protein